MSLYSSTVDFKSIDMRLEVDFHLLIQEVLQKNVQESSPFYTCALFSEAQNWTT